jgi:flagellar biosynthesis protein FlhF
VLVEAVDSDEIHLVLNSSVRDEEMIHSCQRFRDMKITHLTFTRLDESLKHGYLLNVARAAAKPVAWLCSGQNFSGNLQRFSTANLTEWTKITNEPALSRITA